MNSFSEKYLNGLYSVLNEFPHENFDKMIQEIMTSYKEEKNIFVMGNGGSGSTASHWTCDINKGCCLHLEKKFKMICLNDNIPTMMAYANDVTYDDIFVEPMKNFFQPDDLVIGISGSGNSMNVLKAIDYANNNNGRTIGLCGYEGGKLHDMVDIPLLARVNDMQKVEDVHMIIVHISMQAISRELGTHSSIC
ncbi:Sugar-phosphate isomerase [Olavius algarvensis associated proteobacterium Delta 3]|nr:Sugar-phosphate isomerase [Olavius algarvensis associated proteobacterium Delta 3]CAB5122906.1 Sugar-phosphate isomerase [Olavius algarvensis associated proteobacterium Delta 3]